MTNGLKNNKVWWKSKTILAMVGQFLMIWSLYIVGEATLSSSFAVSMTTAAGIIFRSVGHKGIAFTIDKN